MQYVVTDTGERVRQVVVEVDPNASPTISPEAGTSEAEEAVENLRQRDIQYDSNSAADVALNKVNIRSSINRRASATLAAVISHEPVPAATASAAPKKKEKARNAEGKLITQGHDQYALTYGMMLGIRVCVRIYCVICIA
jgi:hypothetical protein